MVQTITTCVLAIILGLSLNSKGVVSVTEPVNLRSADTFVILAQSGITTTGTTSITGDLGCSPATSTAITGFFLIANGPYFTSRLVTGNIFAADSTSPTPGNLITAISDAQTAYTDAAGRTATVLELGAGNIAGITLAPGVYKWTSPLSIEGDITLNGTDTDVWIFQIAQTLNLAAGCKIILSGGAGPAFIFWQVAGAVSLKAGSVLKGTVLAKTSVALTSGATLDGKFLAQTAVTLISNTLVRA